MAVTRIFGDFDSDLTGWTRYPTSGSTLTRVTTEGREIPLGAARIVCNFSSASQWQEILLERQEVFGDVSSGGNVFSAWIKAAADAPCGLEGYIALEYGADSTWLSGDSVALEPGFWTEVTVTAPPEALLDLRGVSVGVGGYALQSSATLFFDDVTQQGVGGAPGSGTLAVGALSGSGVVAGGSDPDRPYFKAADWLWDPIPASPVLHDKNTTWAGCLAAGQHPANIDEYANAIVYLTEIDAATPRYKVSVDNAPAWGPNPFARYQIPVPVAARDRVVPFDGANDAWLIVADPDTQRVFHLWQARWTGSTWQASWGAVSVVTGDGRDDVTGSGLSNFGGTIRLASLRAAAAAGTGLGHALQFSSDATAGSLETQFVHPATKTDGHLWTQVVADRIWQGTRIQLDPSIDVDAISGITAAEKVIARTLQSHGAYLIDNGGARAAFMFERQAGGSITAYAALGLGWDYYNLDKIPWGGLRVLKHWHGGALLEQR